MDKGALETLKTEVPRQGKSKGSVFGGNALSSVPKA